MKNLLLIALILRGLFCDAQNVQFIRKDADRKVDVLISGQFFTAYIYPDEKVLKKPVLFPIKTLKGTTITRGYPLEPRANERTDHPHHVGLWNYTQHVVRRAYTPGGLATDGIAELHFRTRDDFENKFFDSDAGRDVIMADVDRFMDMRRSTASLMTEYVMRA